MSRVHADDVLSRAELEHTHMIKKLLSSLRRGRAPIGIGLSQLSSAVVLHLDCHLDGQRKDKDTMGTRACGGRNPRKNSSQRLRGTSRDCTTLSGLAKKAGMVAVSVRERRNRRAAEGSIVELATSSAG
jgi:hypothetical protein